MKLTRILANIAFPIMVILFFTARELMLIIFGPQWEGAVASFRILSISIVTQALMATGGSIYQAMNKTKLLFISGLINQSITIFCFFAVITFFPNIEAMSYTFTTITFSSFFISYYLIMHFLFNKSMIKALKIFIMPFVLFVVQFIFLYLVSINLNTGLIVSLLVKIAVWAILTLIYFQFFTEFKPKNILQNLFREVFHKS
jgi:PST family polysaccharide transporter